MPPLGSVPQTKMFNSDGLTPQPVGSPAGSTTAHQATRETGSRKASTETCHAAIGAGERSRTLVFSLESGNLLVFSAAVLTFSVFFAVEIITVFLVVRMASPSGELLLN